MSLPRCPRCRSAVYPAWFARCIGCGMEFRDSPPPSPGARPEVVSQAKRDSLWAFGLLVGVGALGIAGIFTGAQHGVLLMATSAAGLVGILALIFRALDSGPYGIGPSCLQLGALLLLCGGALVFGLGILLGLVCTQLVE